VCANRQWPASIFASVRITTIGLHTSRPDAQGPHQRPRHHTDLVTNAQGGIRNPKRLDAGFDHDAAPRASGQIRRQRRGPTAPFLDNLPIAAAHANLRFLSPEIDRKMFQWLASFVRASSTLVVERRYSRQLVAIEVSHFI